MTVAKCRKAKMDAAPESTIPNELNGTLSVLLRRNESGDIINATIVRLHNRLRLALNNDFGSYPKTKYEKMLRMRLPSRTWSAMWMSFSSALSTIPVKS